MKRTLLLISTVLFSVMAVTIFTSCGDDNEDVFTGGAAPTVNGKRLVRINRDEIGYNADGQVVRYKLNYGRVFVRDYSYEFNRIVVSSYNEIYYLTNGRITSLIYDKGESTEATATYEYDNNGYLKKTTYPADVHPMREKEIHEITWKDGNIQKIISNYYIDDIKNAMEETTYTYTPHANNIPSLFHEFTFSLIDHILGWQGYFGKRCKNLPATKIWIEYGIENNSRVLHSKITDNYDYTIENGLVTKIKDVYVFETFDGPTPGTSTNEFEYELVWQ